MLAGIKGVCDKVKINGLSSHRKSKLKTGKLKDEVCISFRMFSPWIAAGQLASSASSSV